jgi:hypothetical protein
MAVNTYSDIDPVIRNWCSRHGLMLHNAFAGQPRRFVYSSQAMECFQISIEPPEMAGSEQTVCVHLRSVETNDDAEIHHSWQVPLGGLGHALEVAIQTIDWLQSRPSGAQPHS